MISAICEPTVLCVDCINDVGVKNCSLLSSNANKKRSLSSKQPKPVPVIIASTVFASACAIAKLADVTPILMARPIRRNKFGAMCSL